MTDRLTELGRMCLEVYPRPERVARVGLGLMLVLAGAHKLLAPAAWTRYLIDPIAPFIIVTPVTFMLVNGLLELGFGIALLIGRGTRVAAGVAAISLSATVMYLGAVALLRSGQFTDLMIRDVGLAALAWAVLGHELSVDTIGSD